MSYDNTCQQMVLFPPTLKIDVLAASKHSELELATSVIFESLSSSSTINTTNKPTVHNYLYKPLHSVRDPIHDDCVNPPAQCSKR